MAELKQYINLEPDPNDKRLGRIVKVKTKIDVKNARTVHVFLEPDPKNRGVKKLGLADRAGIAAANTKHLAVMTEPDGTINIDLVMSAFGGDKFTTKASRDKKKTKVVKAADTYVVWRKLFYQTSEMKPGFACSFGKIVSEYEKHFIELELTSAESCPYKENLETHELPMYRTYFKKTKSPFEVHVVFIDRQCDSRARQISDTLNRPTKFYPYAAGDEEWPFSDWLVTASWSTIGGPSASGGYSVTRAVVGGQRGIQVDITGLVPDPSKNPVMVDIEYKLLEGEYTGDASYKPHIFIAVGKPRSEESISKTVAHELGHGVGMVPIRGHSLQYSNANGGKGSHCRFGAKPKRVSKAQGGTFGGTYSNGLCVMYAFSSEHYHFCGTCSPFVQGAHLFKVDMVARGW